MKAHPPHIISNTLSYGLRRTQLTCTHGLLLHERVVRRGVVGGAAGGGAAARAGTSYAGVRGEVVEWRCAGGVSRRWRAVHDAACQRLRLRNGVTDEGMWVLHALPICTAPLDSITSITTMSAATSTPAPDPHADAILHALQRPRPGGGRQPVQLRRAQRVPSVSSSSRRPPSSAHTAAPHGHHTPRQHLSTCPRRASREHLARCADDRFARRSQTRK